ncbi:bifunctional 5,10-methylenetetrahydrofolate dehydrogenase/5,10-methenyltetrahydrofolate cyclohydrolase [Candidatus Saccharibacteria bacterium]|nr:bifunctional 5,10-methylenetetrahydrofolate dehydrogenase/5,10-methenyltetrahydrofolate cyclohydrolase [Candidatus Saccharibacteria bacterium]
MKILDGSSLASYIKERQATEVRSLIQGSRIQPKLAIIRTNPDPIVDSYMKLKQQYGQDIGVEVEVHTIEQNEAIQRIAKLNNDKSVQGIIVQIPLPNPKQTNEILNKVDPDKDVDGLAVKTKFDAPTPMAITWLLAGYNINLPGKKIAIIGHGRLVGKPLAKLLSTSDLDVSVVDKNSGDLSEQCTTSDIIISATGVPGLITSQMVKPDAVIVDAGVATDSNGLIGDVAPDVREMTDITITPIKGGVGPLTVCALFDNVIRSARNSTDKAK